MPTLLSLLNRWRAEAEKNGHRITRIAVAFEAGHDGFWLARWLAAQGIEAHVIHASSVAVTREHRRAKEHISIAALTKPMEPRHDETQSQDCETLSRFQAVP